MWKAALTGRSERAERSESGSVSGARRKKSRGNTADSVASSSRRADGERKRTRSGSVYEDANGDARGTQYAATSSSRAGALTESAVRALDRDDEDAGWEDDEKGDRRRDRRRSTRDERTKSRSASRDREQQGRRRKDGEKSRSSKSRAETDGSTNVGNGSRSLPTAGSFDQFPGQLTGVLAGPVYQEQQQPLSSSPPMMSGALPSSDPHHQFPAQDPATFTGPAYKPTRADSYGAASEYYLDEGQSVSTQPGIRTVSPNMLVNPAQEQGFVAPSAEPHPVEDTGHGAAADFYEGRGGPGRGSSTKQSSSSSKTRPSSTSTTPARQKSKSSARVENARGEADSYYAQSTQVQSAGTSYYGPPPQSQSSGVSSGKQPLQSQSRPNVPLYAAGAATAGFAAYEVFQGGQNTSQQGNSTSYYNRGSEGGQGPPRPLGGSGSGPYVNGAAMSMNNYRYHEHKGPMTRLKDGILNLISAPEDVQRMEEYTEYIGVCKYCFDPRSSPTQGPRQHHYHRHRDSFEDLRKRRSTEQMYRQRSSETLRRSGSSRVDKDSRYYAADEKRRKASGTGIVGAGLAAAGVAAGANALFHDRKDFDDTYSVKSGHRASSAVRRRSRSSSRERRRRSTYGTVEKDEYVTVRTSDGRLERRKVQRRSRSTSRDRKGSRLADAAAGMAIGAAATSAATGYSRRRPDDQSLRESDRRRSGSRSPGVGGMFGFADRRSKRGGRRSPNGSQYDIASRTEDRRSPQSNGFFGGFFSPPQRKEKHRPRSKERRKKSTGFFTFSNSSSSSSDHGLAFGEGFTSKTNLSLRRKASRRTSDEHIAATVAGISATAAALAAAQKGQKIGKRNGRPELGARRDPRETRHMHQPGYVHGSHGSSNEDEWEDELPSDVDDASSGVESGLAFGDSRLSNRQSMESVSSGDGLSAWGWRWGGKDRKKTRRPASPPDLMNAERRNGSYMGPVGAGLAAGAIAGTVFDNSGRPFPPDSVLPPSSGPPPPMQHIDPRPLSDASNRNGSRYSSTPGAFDYEPPVVRPGPAPIQQPQPIAPANPSFVQSPPEMGDQFPTRRPPPQRSQSSPTRGNAVEDAALIGGAALATAGIIASQRRKSKELGNVRFGLTDEQQKKEEREQQRKEERELRRERERTEDDRRRADRTRALKEEAERVAKEEDARRREEIVRRKREDENRQAAEAELERRRAEQRERQEQAELDRQRRLREEAAKSEQARLTDEARQQEMSRRQWEVTAAQDAQRNPADQRRYETEQRDNSRRGNESRDIWQSSGRAQQEKESASRWNAVAAGVTAAATAGAVLAGAEHMRDEKREQDEDERLYRPRKEVSYSSTKREAAEPEVEYDAKPVTPDEDASGTPMMDDDIYDRDFFKRKRSDSESAREVKQADLARRAADKVIADMDAYYAQPAQSQAEFFAPMDILGQHSEGKTKATSNPDGDSDVQVYRVTAADIQSQFARGKDDRPFGVSRYAPYGVPALNVMPPTPPPGQARVNKSLLGSPLVQAQDVKESEPEPEPEPEPKVEEATKRKPDRNRRISWGQDKTHIYDVDVHTPDSFEEHDSYTSARGTTAATATAKPDDAAIGAAPQSNSRPTSTSEYQNSQDRALTSFNSAGLVNEPGSVKEGQNLPPAPPGPVSSRSQPFARSESDTGFAPAALDRPETEDAPPTKGFVEGETEEPTPAEEKPPHIPGGFDEDADDAQTPEPKRASREVSDSTAEPEIVSWEPTLSKKEQKKREKAARRASTLDSEPTTPARLESEPEPEPTSVQFTAEPEEIAWEPPLSKKDKKKRDKALKRETSDTFSLPPEPETRDEEPTNLYQDTETTTPNLSKKEQKKAGRQGFADVAAAVLTTGGIAALASSAVKDKEREKEDDSSSATNGKKNKKGKKKLGESERDIRDVEPSYEPSSTPTAAADPAPKVSDPGMPGGWDSDKAPSPDPEIVDPFQFMIKEELPSPKAVAGQDDGDPISLESDATKSKKGKKKKKRDSGRFGEPATASPLRSEWNYGNYAGEQAATSSAADPIPYTNGGEEKEDGVTSTEGYSPTTETAKAKEFDEVRATNESEREDNRAMKNNSRHKSQEENTRGSVDEDRPQSVVSEPILSREKGRKSSKSGRSRSGIKDQDESTDAYDDRSVAASEPVDVYESAWKKGRSKYEDDDAMSVTSSRSRSRREKEDPAPASTKKEKKGGLFGLFGRKSQDNKSQDAVPLSRQSTRESTEGDEEDVQRKKHKKKKSREGPIYDEEEDDDSRSVTSDARHRHRLDTDEHEEAGRERRRSSHYDDDESDRRSESGHRHHHRRRTDEGEDDAKDQSFLGIRVEDLPPLPDNDPESSARAPTQDNNEQGFGNPVSAELETQTSTRETVGAVDHSLGDPPSILLQRQATDGESTSDNEITHRQAEKTNLPNDELPNLTPLPVSRPESPTVPFEPLQRPGALMRPVTSTAVPLRFPFGSPRPQQKERATSFSSAATPTPLSPFTPVPTLKKTRQPSTEIMPLYLVEWNNKMPEVEGSLPSLPSSKPSSRASSAHGSEEWHSAVESPPSSDRKRELPTLNTDHINRTYVSEDDYLDSEQTTPKASDFPSQTALKRSSRQEPQYYTWEDFEKDERLHSSALTEVGDGMDVEGREQSVRQSDDATDMQALAPEADPEADQHSDRESHSFHNEVATDEGQSIVEVQPELRTLPALPDSRPESPSEGHRGRKHDHSRSIQSIAATAVLGGAAVLAQEAVGQQSENRAFDKARSPPPHREEAIYPSLAPGGKSEQVLPDVESSRAEDTVPAVSGPDENVANLHEQDQPSSTRKPSLKKKKKGKKGKSQSDGFPKDEETASEALELVRTGDFMADTENMETRAATPSSTTMDQSIEQLKEEKDVQPSERQAVLDLAEQLEESGPKSLEQPHEGPVGDAGERFQREAELQGTPAEAAIHRADTQEFMAIEDQMETGAAQPSSVSENRSVAEQDIYHSDAEKFSTSEKKVEDGTERLSYPSTAQPDSSDVRSVPPDESLAILFSHSDQTSMTHPHENSATQVIRDGLPSSQSHAEGPSEDATGFAPPVDYVNDVAPRSDIEESMAKHEEGLGHPMLIEPAFSGETPSARVSVGDPASFETETPDARTPRDVPQTADVILSDDLIPVDATNLPEERDVSEMLERDADQNAPDPSPTLSRKQSKKSKRKQRTTMWQDFDETPSTAATSPSETPAQPAQDEEATLPETENVMEASDDRMREIELPHQATTPNISGESAAYEGLPSNDFAVHPGQMASESETKEPLTTRENGDLPPIDDSTATLSRKQSKKAKKTQKARAWQALEEVGAENNNVEDSVLRSRELEAPVQVDEAPVQVDEAPQNLEHKSMQLNDEVNDLYSGEITEVDPSDPTTDSLKSEQIWETKPSSKQSKKDKKKRKRQQQQSENDLQDIKAPLQEEAASFSHPVLDVAAASATFGAMDEDSEHLRQQKQDQLLAPEDVALPQPEDNEFDNPTDDALHHENTLADVTEGPPKGLIDPEYQTSGSGLQRPDDDDNQTTSNFNIEDADYAIPQPTLEAIRSQGTGSPLAELNISHDSAYTESEAQVPPDAEPADAPAGLADTFSEEKPDDISWQPILKPSKMSRKSKKNASATSNSRELPDASSREAVLSSEPAEAAASEASVLEDQEVAESTDKALQSTESESLWAPKTTRKKGKKGKKAVIDDTVSSEPPPESQSTGGPNVMPEVREAAFTPAIAEWDPEDAKIEELEPAETKPETDWPVFSTSAKKKKGKKGKSKELTRQPESEPGSEPIETDTQALQTALEGPSPTHLDVGDGKDDLVTEGPKTEEEPASRATTSKKKKDKKNRWSTWEPESQSPTPDEPEALSTGVNPTLDVGTTIEADAEDESAPVSKVKKGKKGKSSRQTSYVENPAPDIDTDELCEPMAEQPEVPDAEGASQSQTFEAEPGQSRSPNADGLGEDKAQTRKLERTDSAEKKVDTKEATSSATHTSDHEQEHEAGVAVRLLSVQMDVDDAREIADRDPEDAQGRLDQPEVVAPTAMPELIHHNAAGSEDAIITSQVSGENERSPTRQGTEVRSSNDPGLQLEGEARPAVHDSPTPAMESDHSHEVGPIHVDGQREPTLDHSEQMKAEERDFPNTLTEVEEVEPGPSFSLKKSKKDKKKGKKSRAAASDLWADSPNEEPATPLKVDDDAGSPASNVLGVAATTAALTIAAASIEDRSNGVEEQDTLSTKRSKKNKRKANRSGADTPAIEDPETTRNLPDVNAIDTERSIGPQAVLASGDDSKEKPASPEPPVATSYDMTPIEHMAEPVVTTSEGSAESRDVQIPSLNTDQEPTASRDPSAIGLVRMHASLSSNGQSGESADLSMNPASKHKHSSEPYQFVDDDASSVPLPDDIDNDWSTKSDKEVSQVTNERHLDGEIDQEAHSDARRNSSDLLSNPSHDIDFAATLAAGLAGCGFDPNLVVDDPVFHRRSSPPGVVAEADPEEVFTPATRRGKKGKKGKRSQDVSERELDSGESAAAKSTQILNFNEPPDDFDAVLSKGLQGSGFDPALLQRAASSGDVTPSNSRLDEQSDLTYSTSKRKKGKKGKKAAFADSVQSEKAIESSTTPSEWSESAAPFHVLDGSERAEMSRSQADDSVEISNVADADRRAEAADSAANSDEMPSFKTPRNQNFAEETAEISEMEPSAADPEFIGGDPSAKAPEMDVEEMDRAYSAFKRKERRLRKKQRHVASESDQTQGTAESTDQDTVTRRASRPEPPANLVSAAETDLSFEPIDKEDDANAERSPDAADDQIGTSPTSSTSRVQSVFPGLQRVKRKQASVVSSNDERQKRRTSSSTEPEGFLHTSEVSQSLPVLVEPRSRSSDTAIAEGQYKSANGVTHIDSSTDLEVPGSESPQNRGETGLAVAGAVAMLGLGAAAEKLGSDRGGRVTNTGNEREEVTADMEADQPFHGRTYQPEWSFAGIEGENKPSPDSPSLNSKQRQIVKDSEYQQASSARPSRHFAERVEQDVSGIRTVHSRESLHSRRSADPLHISTDSATGWDGTAPRSRSLDSQERLALHARTPSHEKAGTPLVSTTKNRASYLFRSPPSQLQEVLDAAGQHRPDARAGISGNVNQAHPGAMEEAASDTPVLSSDNIDRMASSTYPADLMTREQAMQSFPDEHHAAKRSKAQTDVGGPEHIKAINRAETPQAIRMTKQERTLSSHESPASAIESSGPHSDNKPLSTDELIGRLSWPAVDDENGTVNLERSLQRKPSKRISSDQRPPSAMSNRSNISGGHIKSPGELRSYSRASNRSSTPTLRRTDRSISGDLRAASRRGNSGSSVGARSSPRTIPFEPPPTPPLNDEDVIHEGAARGAEMDDVFQGYGDAQESQVSPTRPPNMRKRQSMHIVDLESRLDQLVAENRALQDAKSYAEQSYEATGIDGQTTRQALETRDLRLREKDAEINQIRAMLQPMQDEIARLTEINGELTEVNRNLVDDTNGRYATLQSEHAHAHEKWQSATRELDDLRQEHGRVTTGMTEFVETRTASALADKNAEISRLREELEIATEQIRALQVQIQSSRSNDFLKVRDEDYFDGACQKLCQHAQQWVLRFSKLSDNRVCRLSTEINDDKIESRLDNAILDGSDTDKLLGDRVRRRDVFMSVVMTMVWEYVFTRYLFGMDREQRQKLKALEKILAEVGPARAVAQWRATTLTLLSKRPDFARQCQLDTEAVAHEIFAVLCSLLPPPSSAEQQLVSSLQKVIGVAVDLSIEMRTQRSEFIMLPPLQPEYDTNGDLVRQVHFNASLMTERSGMFGSMEQLEQERAVVKIVLFPLVVRKGDESGEGEEEIVVCPAQVLVQNDNGKGKKVVRVMSGAMEIDDPRTSRQSLLSMAPGSSTF